MKNKGFSLVELLVVIAILAVLAISAGFGVSNVMGYRLTKAQSLIYQSLEETKANAMSRDQAYFTIYADEDGDYYIKTESGMATRLGDGGMSIIYTCRGTNTDNKIIDSGHALTLSFDRASGAFLPIIAQVEEIGRASCRERV